MYGGTIKELIHEKSEDGIMSATDCTTTLTRMKIRQEIGLWSHYRIVPSLLVMVKN